MVVEEDKRSLQSNHSPAIYFLAESRFFLNLIERTPNNASTFFLLPHRRTVYEKVAFLKWREILLIGLYFSRFPLVSKSVLYNANFLCCITKLEKCSNFVVYYFCGHNFSSFLLRFKKLKMTLQKMIFKTNRKECTTRGIPRRSLIRVLTSPDSV